MLRMQEVGGVQDMTAVVLMMSDAEEEAAGAGWESEIVRKQSRGIPGISRKCMQDVRAGSWSLYEGFLTTGTRDAYIEEFDRIYITFRLREAVSRYSLSFCTVGESGHTSSIFLIQSMIQVFSHQSGFNQLFIDRKGGERSRLTAELYRIWCCEQQGNVLQFLIALLINLWFTRVCELILTSWVYQVWQRFGLGLESIWWIYARIENTWYLKGFKNISCPESLHSKLTSTKLRMLVVFLCDE